MTDGSPNAVRCRMDLWLYNARYFKTRRLATSHVRAGKVRINGRRIRKASALVGVGDVLTFQWHKDIIVLRIVALAERRGPASEAQSLYERLDAQEAP